MKVVLLREYCPDRVSCPQLYTTDKGTYVVQGYISTDLTHDSGQAVVEIPLALVPELAAHKHVDLYLTDRGTVLVRGTKVTDQEALSVMRLPSGEDAVELAADVLPPLEVVADAR
jgi:hypothetical protein